MQVPRYVIDLTERCNLQCRWCNKFLDLIQVPDSELTPEDVRLGAARMRAAGLSVDKIKVSGGQPTLHAKFAEMVKLIKDEWSPKRLVVLTNGTLPVPEVGRKVRITTTLPSVKQGIHYPVMISPSDLGIDTKGVGYRVHCRPHTNCGRQFDHFGFSFCPFAGPMGRVLGVDPYSPTPMLMGLEDVCRHCIYALPTKTMAEVTGRAVRGETLAITETFQKGLDQYNKSPVAFKRFLER